MEGDVSHAYAVEEIEPLLGNLGGKSSPEKQEKEQKEDCRGKNDVAVPGGGRDRRNNERYEEPDNGLLKEQQKELRLQGDGLNSDPMVKSHETPPP